jgi:hypothetical protein
MGTMSPYLLPENAVVIEGVAHIVLRDATETMCGLPVTGQPAPARPSLAFCDTCSKSRAELMDRDIRRELSHRR